MEVFLPESKALEKQLIQSLRKENIRSMNDISALVFLKNIHALNQKNKRIEVATHYAALAAVIERDASLALQAARGYQKAGDLDAAARWYLITAERYANDMRTSKSVAALRIYNHLKPANKRIPQRIYNFCIKHGARLENPPSILLSPADLAGSQLLTSGFFNSFGSSDLDQLLRKLTYRKFQDGEIIRKMDSKATALYIIVSGSISGYLTLNNKRTYLGNTDDNNICGETSYFTDIKRTEELISKGTTEVFGVPYVVLDKYKAKLPAFDQRIEKIYQSRILVKQLALTSLFRDATMQHHKWIAAKMNLVSVQKDSVLMSQGEKSFDLYLLRKGHLAITINLNGTEQLLKNLEANSIIGEIAIIANQRRTATVTATTDCVLMKLDAKDYKAYYNNSKLIQKALKKLKKKYVLESFDLIKNKTKIDSCDTCEILIKEIWQG